jgi:hypothetical protein
MQNTTKSTVPVNVAGWITYITGWIVLFLSVWFALPASGDSPSHTVLYHVSLAILAGMTLVYITARLVSKRWRSRAGRFYFSPYLIGATCWLILFLAGFIVGRIVR